MIGMPKEEWKTFSNKCLLDAYNCKFDERKFEVNSVFLATGFDSSDVHMIGLEDNFVDKHC